MIGQTLLHYEVIEKLGSGGMGVVYRARDTKLGREVAIKVLPESFSKDKERLARFEREARLLASLNHPNIATIHDLEEVEGVRFLVLELVPGETLAERIKRGPLSVDETLPLFVQIAEALEAAHENGVIHRDSKPANVKVTPAGKAKVLDFGLAKALSGKAPPQDLSESPTLTKDATETGALLGTAPYMSPEQARGRAADKRADIWAFGCCLYEALTGKTAFLGETVSDTIAAILKQEPDWKALPDATPSLVRRLLRRCLRKDVNERLHDIADARIEIKEALDEPLHAAVAGEAIELPRRMRWQKIGFGVAIGVIVLMAVTLWVRTPPPEEKPVMRVVVPTEELGVMRYVPLALSPDDKQLVYSAVTDGRRQLYLRELASAEATPIPGTDNGEQPFFSPDGQWVGFIAEGKLKKVSLLGGPPLTLTDLQQPQARALGLLGVSWASDASIVFGDGLRQAIRSVSVDGGTPQAVTALDHEKYQFTHCCPQMLPGGGALLFTALDTSCGNPSIVVQSLTSGEQQILIEGATAPRYLPTGHIVYVEAATLLAAPFDLAKLELTGAPVPLVEDIKMGACEAAHFTISERGSLAYIAGGELQSENNILVWVDREGNEELITRKPNMYGPRLSPDGKRLALWVYGDDPQVWMYDFARDTFSQLTVDRRGFWPLWTPDGRRLSFNSDVPGDVPGEQSDSDLFWLSTDGSGFAEELFDAEFAQVSSSWSPDGKQLVFHHGHRNPGFDIWVMSVDGNGDPRPFLATPANEYQGVLSPDGKWIAYVSNETGRDEIYLSSFPEASRRWTLSDEGGTDPAWAPTGQELFYRQGARMMAVELSTESELTPMKPRVLFVRPYALGNVYGRNYDVAADGRFIMLKSEEEASSTQVNIIFNWVEELKRRVPTN